MEKIFIIIISILIIFSIITPIYYYNKYLHNDFREESIKIIKKLKEKESSEDIFSTIKKYYINLDRSTERRESIENEFRDYDVKNYERIKACDSKGIKNIGGGKFDDIEFENKFYKNISLNEFSCTCSHLKAIKKAYDDGEEMAIIMEDDLKFTLNPYWLKPLKDIIENLPEDLEVLQLASQHYGTLDLWNFLKKREIKTDYKKVELIHRKKELYTCAICYLITRKGMKKIHDTFYKNSKLIFPNYKEKNIVIDTGVFDFMNTYSLSPPFFLTDSFELDSTIVNARNVYYQNLKLLQFYEKQIT